MKQVSEMPTSGQFVAVWLDTESGNLFSDTLYWNDCGYLCSNTLDRELSYTETSDLKEHDDELDNYISQLTFFIAD